MREEWWMLIKNKRATPDQETRAALALYKWALTNTGHRSLMHRIGCWLGDKESLAGETAVQTARKIAEEIVNQSEEHRRVLIEIVESQPRDVRDEDGFSSLLRTVGMVVCGVCLLVATLNAQSMLPDARLTPGAVASHSRAEVCEYGYSRAHRKVPISEKRRVYARYGIIYVAGEKEIDHAVPLSLGGANAITNLWPQPNYGVQWTAADKDRLEAMVPRLVCAGQMDLGYAQRSFATNWIALYQEVFSQSRKRNYARRN